MAIAKKPVSALLKKPVAGKSYTKTQLIAHLAEAVTNQGLGDISKKQAAAFLEELSEVLINYSKATTGATLPGVGKLLLKKTPKKPAREGRNPATGETIQIAAKPAGKKLLFRISKVAKESAGVI